MKTVQLLSVKNKINELFLEFMKGNEFPVSLSNKIIKTVDIDNTIEYSELTQAAKEYLNSSYKSVYKNIYIIKNIKELEDKEKAVIVRLINLAHKNKHYIIVCNSQVIYVPEVYSNESADDFMDTISKTIYHRYLERKQVIFFKCIKTYVKKVLNFYYLKNAMKKVVT